MNLFAKFIVALFVVFLHYIGPIGIRAVNKHRYLLGWSRKDASAIVLGMLALAIGILGIDLLVDWSNSAILRQLFNHLFLVGLVSGWIAAFHQKLWARPNVIHLIWMTAAAIIGYSFVRSDTPLVHYAAWSCLILSPLILLITMQMFSWQTWSSEPAPRPATSPQASQGTPVYFFIFDEWSFARSTGEGEFLPDLKNLRKLCNQAVVFRKAISPFTKTWKSLPAILFQTDKAYTLHNGEPQFLDRDRMIPVREMDNLFRLSQRYNYTSYLLGWYHAYQQMFGDDVNYCRVYRSAINLVADESDQSNCQFVSHEKSVDAGIIGKALYGILGIFPYLTDPVSQLIWRRLDLDPSIMCWQKYRMGERYRNEMLQVLRESPPKTFAFFHTPWPHAPFVFSPDGSYAGTTAESTNPAHYLRHIRYVDHLVGEIVGTLQAAGKFDDCMLIITSDHGWDADPDPTLRALPKFDRSVPLVIKLPGQTVGHFIEEEFCNNQLMPLVEAVFSGNKSSEELTELLEQLAAGRLSPTSTEWQTDAAPQGEKEQRILTS